MDTFVATISNYNIHTFKKLTVYHWLCWISETTFSVLFYIQNKSSQLYILGCSCRYIKCTLQYPTSAVNSALWLHYIICRGSISNMQLLDSVTEITHKKYWYAIQKHSGCKKSKVKLKAPFKVNVYTYMQLKGLISGRGQRFLKFDHFMQPFTVTCKQTSCKHCSNQ